MSPTRLSFYFSVCLCIALFSCKKETNVGSSLISNDNKFYGTLVDTLTVEAYTEADTATPAENRSRALIGELNDPEFGITKARWYAQFLITNSIDAGTSPAIDSIVLSFHVDTVYGPASTTTFRAYELSTGFASTTYYSNDTIACGAELGNTTVASNSKVVYIKLPNQLGQRILNATGDTLNNNNSFLQLLKGISIKGEQTSLNTNEGAIYVVNPSDTSTKISLYYKNTSAVGQQKANISITSSSRHFNNLTHDFTVTTDLNNQLNNKSLGANRLFLQPLSGTHIELKFPTLYNWNKNNHHIIQRAELILPIEASSNIYYCTPSDMSVLLLDSNNVQVYLEDMTTFANYDIPSPNISLLINNIPRSIRYGGHLETDKYRFLITQFINDVATTNTKNNTLILNPIGSSISPYRTIFSGTSLNNSTRTKLLVYYTK